MHSSKYVLSKLFSDNSKKLGSGAITETSELLVSRLKHPHCNDNFLMIIIRGLSLLTNQLPLSSHRLILERNIFQNLTESPNYCLQLIKVASCGLDDK